MKLKCLNLLLLLFSIHSFSQNLTYVDWENPNNFKKFKITKVHSYSYKINKKGKIKKDSLLLNSYEYNQLKSSISGINNDLMVFLHGGENQRNFYIFKNEYIKDSLIIKKSRQPIRKLSSKKDEMENNCFYEIYEYNNLNRNIKKTTFEEKNKFSINKNDTISNFKSINNPKIFEYEYNTQNKLIKAFETIDSTEYYIKFDKKKDFKRSKSCVYCNAKYLINEWKYANDKIIEFTSYIHKNEIHTKREYFYDENLKLKREIDSTGFYLSKPYLSSITEFLYNENNSIEVETNYGNNMYYKNSIKTYDEKNRIINELKKAESQENNLEIKTEYLKNEIIQISHYPKNEIYKKIYIINNKGLTVELKEYLNDKMTNLERYYYD